jgi:hypothetical protein
MKKEGFVQTLESVYGHSARRARKISQRESFA